MNAYLNVIGAVSTKYKRNADAGAMNFPVARFDYIEVGPRLRQQYANPARVEKL